MKIKKFLNTILLFEIIFLLQQNIFAAGDELNTVMSIMLVFTVIIIAATLWLSVVYSEKNDNEGKAFLNPYRKFMKMLTKSTPIENEKDILLDHEYDGIKELDSKVPPWFAFLFYGTIVFSIIYMIRFHVIGSGDVQAEEYLEEIRAAQVERQILIKTGAFLNEETVTFTKDAGALSNGKDIFIKNCAACHANDGGGLVGPNLTDEYWINGGGIKNVFKVIKYGVPAKGMISWQTQLSPTQMQEVASYILTLEGTEPANPKQPEGEKWIEPKEEETKS